MILDLEYCEATKKDDGTWWCPKCGYEHSNNVRFFRQCGPIPQRTYVIETTHKDYFPDGWQEELQELGEHDTDEQSLRQLYTQWRAAIQKWKMAGKPVRTKEEVQAAYETCQGCDYYAKRAGFGHCKKCGCHVNLLNVGQLNKIKMATESCPLGKW